MENAVVEVVLTKTQDANFLFGLICGIALGFIVGRFMLRDKIADMKQQAIRLETASKVFDNEIQKKILELQNNILDFKTSCNDLLNARISQLDKFLKDDYMRLKNQHETLLRDTATMIAQLDKKA